LYGIVEVIPSSRPPWCFIKRFAKLGTIYDSEVGQNRRLHKGFQEFSLSTERPRHQVSGLRFADTLPDDLRDDALHGLPKHPFASLRSGRELRGELQRKLN
jgi:hypothetical protein